jgi:hypothetical protein
MIFFKEIGSINIWKHGPAHFHAYYQDSKAIVDIHTCEVMDGTLPIRQKKLVLVWAELHRDELVADWELASNGELPYPIEPLR